MSVALLAALMLIHRSSALRKELRTVLWRAALTAALGLTWIAAAVAMATLTRMQLWWLPLACGTVAFGAGLALVPRARRIRSELVSVERRSLATRATR